MSRDHSTSSPEVDHDADLPDRLCTWCQVPMRKRIVGGGLYVHYTCPKCVFQHASKRQPPGTPRTS